MRVKALLINGFTLIEILIVISIIGILAAFALTSYQGAQKQSRDTQRKSDLSQYRIALEAYYNAHGNYPTTGTNTSYYLINDSAHQAGICNDLDLVGSGYLSKCLGDPADFGFYYYVYTTNPVMTVYVMSAKLETTGDYFYMCSNGKSGRVAARPTACP